MFVHGKTCVGRPVYKHCDGIKSAFMKEVVGIVGLEHAMSKGTELLWCIIDEPPTTPAAKASTSKPDLKAADAASKASIVDHTNLQAECEKRGFKKGCAVIQTATKTKWTLKNMTTRAADIEKDGAKMEVMPGDLIDEFKAVEVFETQAQKFDKYPDPSKNPELQAQLAIGVKRVALAKAYDEHSVTDSFEMRTYKKQRNLHSTVDSNKGELVLVPLTWNIALAKSKEDIPPGHVPFGVVATGDAASIAPTRIEKDENDANVDKKEKEEFMVPYWLVRGTQEEERVNLVEGHVNVDVGGTSVQVPVLKNNKG